MRAANEHRAAGGVSSSGAGFLLVDSSSLASTYANDDAIQILTYPTHPQQVQALDRFLAKKLQSLLSNGQNSLRVLPAFQSGKRHYRCRAFSVESQSHSKDPSHATVILFERGRRDSVDIAEAAAAFHLTERECETATLLLQGLSTKDIAARMKVSPNTVKAFIRLIMIKMNVSTRAGVVGKIIQAQP